MIRHILYPAMCLAAMHLAAGAIRAADAPATQPAGFILRGHVAISGGIDLAKPDLTRAVVYLDSDPALDAAPLPPGSATVAQKNKAFVPDFVAVPRGTQVEFPNWDHISHNVFSRSAAAPAFDLDRYPYGQSKTQTFSKVGVVQIFCNIHPYMKAIVFVTPNVYFTRAAADGSFQINNIPAGRYQASVWQERCGTQHQAVEIGGATPAEITFNLSEDRDSILSNDPPARGGAYGVERGLGIKREKLGLPVNTESHPAPTTEPCPLCP